MTNRSTHARWRLHGWITVSWLALLGLGAAAACTSDDARKRRLAEGCTLDSDCNGNLVCTFLRCHAVCQSSKDCAGGGRCVQLEGGNVCLLDEEAPCSAEKQCPAPLVCAADLQCRKQCGESSVCISDQTCAVGGTCAETTEVRSDGTLRGAPPDAGGGNGGAEGGGESGAGGTSTGGTGTGAGGRASSDGGTAGGGAGGVASGGADAGARDGGGGLPDGGDAGFVQACDVFGQTSCASNEKCAWVEDSSVPLAGGRVDCVPNGTVGLGQACSLGGSGYDDCGKGLACVNRTCKAVCDATAGSGLRACDPVHACSAYATIFATSTGVNFAGVCEPACNPLTQRRLTDDAANCGGTVDTTPNPPQPSRGCYGVPPAMGPTPFVCSPAGPASNTSDVVCSAGNSCATAGGDAYINGCAPGFLAILLESQYSSNFVCAAMCEPGDTSAIAPANAAGKVGSSHTCPAKGAGGTHECRFWWWLEKPSSPITPNSNALGICYDYTKYLFDSNDDQIPDRTQPSCTSLSATAHTYSQTKTDTQYWGCEAVTARPQQWSP